MLHFYMLPYVAASRSVDRTPQWITHNLHSIIRDDAWLTAHCVSLDKLEPCCESWTLNRGARQCLSCSAERWHQWRTESTSTTYCTLRPPSNVISREISAGITSFPARHSAGLQITLRKIISAAEASPAGGVVVSTAGLELWCWSTLICLQPSSSRTTRRTLRTTVMQADSHKTSNHNNKPRGNDRRRTTVHASAANRPILSTHGHRKRTGRPVHAPS